MYLFKSLLILDILLVLVSILFLNSTSINAQSSEEYDDEETEIESTGPNDSCKKSIYNFLMKILNEVLNCLGGKLPFANIFELGTRFYCILKCTLKGVNVLNSEGYLDEVQALFFLQDNIPEAIREGLVESASPCLDLADLFRPEEYYCPSYAQFTRCFLGVLVSDYLPFVLNCFATPSVGFFLGFIDSIVPRSLAGGGEAESILNLLLGIGRNFLPLPQRPFIAGTSTRTGSSFNRTISNSSSPRILRTNTTRSINNSKRRTRISNGSLNPRKLLSKVNRTMS